MQTPEHTTTEQLHGRLRRLRCGPPSAKRTADIDAVLDELLDRREATPATAPPHLA